MSTAKATISPENWFAELLGFPETEFNYTADELPEKYRNAMGLFKQLSIKKLKECVDLSNENNTNLPLQVLYRSSYGVHIDKFDTSALQYNAMPNTLFQVASNFNCLENPKENYNVFNGYFITNLMTDTTQGPSAAGGAAFGAINRMINHRERPIDLLSDTPIKSYNGKVTYRTGMNIPEFNTDLIKIGLQLNTQACFLRSDRFEYNPSGPLINQVFTSTCICIDSKPNQLSRTLLTAAYEATYLAAILTDAPELVLTMIGGGVFNNNLCIIVDAMMKAHIKYSPYLKKNCKVTLPIYVPTPEYIIEQFKKYKDVKIISL